MTPPIRSLAPRGAGRRARGRRPAPAHAAVVFSVNGRRNATYANAREGVQGASDQNIVDDLLANIRAPGGGLQYSQLVVVPIVKHIVRIIQFQQDLSEVRFKNSHTYGNCNPYVRLE